MLSDFGIALRGEAEIPKDIQQMFNVKCYVESFPPFTAKIKRTSLKVGLKEDLKN